MPDVRTMFDKQYLYAYDLQGRDVTVTISKVVGGTLTGTGGKSNKKPIIFFQGTKKGLALNITNAKTIASMYGGFKSEDWIGKRITLYPTTTSFGSQSNIECIRIRPTPPKSGKDTPPVEAPVEREPGSDDDETAAS